VSLNRSPKLREIEEVAARLAIWRHAGLRWARSDRSGDAAGAAPLTGPRVQTRLHVPPSSGPPSALEKTTRAGLLAAATTTSSSHGGGRIPHLRRAPDATSTLA